MKNLDIFKYDISFKWIEIYVGIIHSWINASDVLDFIRNNKVEHASEEEYIELYWALDESLYEFMRCLVKYTGKDLPIEADNCRIENLPETLSSQIWKKWELEFLLELKQQLEKAKKPLSDKIYDIYLLWCDLKYFKVKWDKFLWTTNLNCQNEELLYNNFLEYIEDLKNELIKRK